MNRVQKRFIKDCIKYMHRITEVADIEFIRYLAEMPEDRTLTTVENKRLNRIQKYYSIG